MAQSERISEVIRQGSLLRLTAFDSPSDIRWTIVRYDHATDHYTLQSTRALHEHTIERCIVHSWLRSKRLTLERKGPKV
jgi:hypothetical protein